MIISGFELLTVKHEKEVWGGQNTLQSLLRFSGIESAPYPKTRSWKEEQKVRELGSEEYS